MKDRVFTIRLDEQESEKLSELARSFGMKRSEFIRGVINGEIIMMVSDERLEKAVGQILKGATR